MAVLQPDFFRPQAVARWVDPLDGLPTVSNPHRRLVSALLYAALALSGAWAGLGSTHLRVQAEGTVEGPAEAGAVDVLVRLEGAPAELVRAGMPARVRVLGESARWHAAEVVATTAPTAANGAAVPTRLLRLRVALASGQGGLAEGDAVLARVSLGAVRPVHALFGTGRP